MSGEQCEAPEVKPILQKSTSFLRDTEALALTCYPSNLLQDAGMSKGPRREGTPQRYPGDRGRRGVLEETTKKWG